MGKQGLRWGILGTGVIANRFADNLKTLEHAVLSAVGSRRRETADAFGERHGIAQGKRFASYEALVESPDVDIVYIASPHSHHAQHMTLALHAGKHVLCEKAFTLNRREAAEVFALAERKGLHVTEAMWTRFLPANRALAALLETGAFGELIHAHAFFGRYFPDDLPLDSRLLNPALGGGGLLDMGVYAVSYVSMLSGDQAPCGISTTGDTIPETGVDAQALLTMQYAPRFFAVAGSAIRADMKPDAYLSGTAGSVFVPSFWQADRLQLTLHGQTELRDYPHTIGKLAYQAQAVTEDILAGRTESSVMPHRATLQVLDILDTARAALGCSYPADRI